MQRGFVCCNGGLDRSRLRPLPNADIPGASLRQIVPAHRRRVALITKNQTKSSLPCRAYTRAQQALAHRTRRIVLTPPITLAASTFKLRVSMLGRG